MVSLDLTPMHASKCTQLMSYRVDAHPFLFRVAAKQSARGIDDQLRGMGGSVFRVRLRRIQSLNDQPIGTTRKLFWRCRRLKQFRNRKSEFLIFRLAPGVKHQTGGLRSRGCVISTKATRGVASSVLAALPINTLSLRLSKRTMR